MEKVVQKTSDLKNQIQIYGDRNQVFQIVLKANDAIMINRQYVMYASSGQLEEVPYHEVNSLYPHEKYKSPQIKKIKNENIIRLKNKGNGFEYVGLSKGGKIMKITPLFYTDLYVKTDSLIAFSDSIELIEDSDYKKKIDTYFGTSIMMKIRKIFINKDFVLLRSKYHNRTIKDNEAQSLISSQTIDLASLISEYLYLQSEQILIEKRLGDNEQIIILKNGLVAFEKSVSFYKISKNQTQNKKLSYVNSNEDIIIEGPGLVIFNPYPRVKINIARVIISVVIPLLIVLIEVIISYLI